ncbi:hypothetical protein [Kitasatospora sp. NPDC088134]|uniref:hypothetical protein n=1 Tax=Kitasatospora sp. NPDC088134 TaxID=3364071 RepID=UPI0037F88678
MGNGTMRAGAAAIGAVALLLAGAAGCTGSGGTGGAASVAPKDAVPAQPLPEPPSPPALSPFASPPEKQPTAFPTPSALPRAEAERAYLALIREGYADTHPEFKQLPDERLLALGDGICSILRAGQPVLNAQNWLAGQGYQDSGQVSALLLAAAGNEWALCADQSVRIRQELLGQRPHS